MGRDETVYVLFDMDGTLTTTEFNDEYSSVWHLTAQVLGEDALAAQEEMVGKWVDGHEDFMRNGGKDYELFADATAAMHQEQGLTRDVFQEEVLPHIGFQPGVEETVAALHEDGYRTAIVSGGMGPQADYVADHLGIDTVYAACAYEWDDAGGLREWTIYPSDHAGKTAFMYGLLAETGHTPANVVFVGDGKNDAHIARNVSQHGGVSVGYDPHDRLAAVVDYVIDPEEEDFSAVLDLV